MKSINVDLHQRTMLLKKKDRKNENRGLLGLFPIDGSDSEEEDNTVEKENEELKLQMR